MSLIPMTTSTCERFSRPSKFVREVSQIPIPPEIETKGLNLNNVNTETLAFYYVDSNNDLIKMPCDDILVDKNAGVIKVLNAKVPHFSRYAIAFSR